MSAPISAPARANLLTSRSWAPPWARAIFHVERPTVGLLNVGVEEIKGADEVKEAHALLKQLQLPLDYRGFVEGDEIGQGKVDVVVVEGFAGNIALKTAEGTAKQISQYIKDALTAVIHVQIGRRSG